MKNIDNDGKLPQKDKEVNTILDAVLVCPTIRYILEID